MPRRQMHPAVRRAAFGLVALCMFALANATLQMPAEGAGPETSFRYVATNGTDAANDCGNPLSPCRSIQHAVDVAGFGDNVLIAGGTYTGVSGRIGDSNKVVTQVVYVSKTIDLRGGYSADFASRPQYPRTTLDAGGAGRGLYITGDVTTTIEWLGIIGGNARGLGGSTGGDSGGGAYLVASGPTFIDCHFLGNSVTGWGGGLYSLGGRPAIIGVWFQANTAFGGGGGAFVQDSTGVIARSWFDGNFAGLNGGGLYIAGGSPTVANSVFNSNHTATYDSGGAHLLNSMAFLSKNRFELNFANGAGGALSIQSGAPTVVGNAIISNTALGRGGGVNIWRGSAPRLDANLINGNTTQGSGGGIALSWQDEPVLTSVFSNTVLVGNLADVQGSAIFAESAAAHFWHTTVAGNTGPGAAIYATNLGAEYSRVALTNTIIMSQSIAAASQGWPTGTLLLDGLLDDRNRLFTNVDVRHGVVGNAAFAEDGYHITLDSAAIDAGLLTDSSSDLDGRGRPIGRPDLGAHEGGGRSYLPVVVRLHSAE